MVSLMTKILLLIVSLACLSHFGATYTLVPGIAVNGSDPIPQRLEIRTFMQNSTRRNIFLIALERMQQTDTNQLLSYYLISGIHGTNLTWDNDTGGNYRNGSGYCYHRDRLFLPWHRPYLSLYEKTLLDLATQIVQNFSAGATKNNHLAVLKTWRMPYWDWAMNSSIPSIMSSKTVSVKKMENGTLRIVTIPNPLASYRLQIANDSNVAIFLNRSLTIQTVRNPTVQNNTYVTRAVFTNKQMIAIIAELKSGVYDALTLSTDYNSFSNVADGAFSIEGVHGTVHVVVGGDEGHMTYSKYSAFDPIFYLHHANVDRLFAIWQVLYPYSYISNNTLEFPNTNTELHPFRKTDSQYWTPKLAQNITSLGYTYPELASCDQSTVINTINNLYGPTPPPPARRRRALSPITSATSATSSTTLNFARATFSLLNTSFPESITKITAVIPSTSTTTTGTTTRITTTSSTTFSAIYDEYKALIQISSTASDGSFLVCVYLGKPCSDDSNYTADPNFVGLFGVFAPDGSSKMNKKSINIAVSLTDALYKRIPTTELKNPNSKMISAYLSANLHLRIGASQNRNFDLKGFQIDVLTAKLNLPKKKDVMPIWGNFKSVYKATKVDLENKIDFLPISSDVSMADELDITDATSGTDDLADL